eukprot:2211830-Pleurochrysis_carterae.AAC.2
MLFHRNTLSFLCAAQLAFHIHCSPCACPLAQVRALDAFFLLSAGRRRRGHLGAAGHCQVPALAQAGAARPDALVRGT